MLAGSMKIYAVSDLHLDFAANRRLLEGFPEHPDDWLVIAGDHDDPARGTLTVLRVHP